MGDRSAQPEGRAERSGGWLDAGRRIKAEWAAMLDGLRERSEGRVKVPFVPLRVSGRTLRVVLEDLLPMLLGRNPSLLTVVSEGGSVAKVYAEDASSGVYERLVPLGHSPRASRDELRMAARAKGIEIGVTKSADARFFERFAEEPAGLLPALALFVAGVAAAVREGDLSFEPELPVARLLRALRLSPASIEALLRSLLPDGAYGLGMQCGAGAAALVVEAAGGAWRASEAWVPGGDVGDIAGELVDERGCGLALAVRLPDVSALIRGELAPARFLRSRRESWDVRTRSGAEGILAVLPGLVRLAGLEGDLAECGITVESVLNLARSYASNAASHARDRGVAAEVTTTGGPVGLTWDASGVRDEAGSDPIRLDAGLARRAVSVLASDPLSDLAGLVPREVMDLVSYSTALVLLDCGRAGRLALFGGPHRFFDRSWEGDACAVFLDAAGRATTAEFPSTPLAIAPRGGRVSFDGPGFRADLAFEEAVSRTEVLGPARLARGERVARLLPGLEVTRSLLRFASGWALLRGRALSFRSGWLFLERGSGPLLRWPLGATWHYVSFLSPDGSCGAGQAAAPMLGRETPAWLLKLAGGTVDGGTRLSPSGTGPAEFVPALDPGPPARLVAPSALLGERELRAPVLSAVVAPFDEDDHVVFRLRCLVGREGEGVGLVEVPAALPGAGPGARECEVAFGREGVSLAADGRELLLVRTEAPGFLLPYEPRGAGMSLVARALRSVGRAFLGRPPRT